MPGEGDRAGPEPLCTSHLLRELGKLQIQPPPSFSKALCSEGPSSVANVQILIGVGLGVQVFSSSLFPGFPHEAVWLFPCFPAQYSKRCAQAAGRRCA